MICRVCGTDETQLIYDLGEQYLSDFREENVKGNKYPLRLYMCNECMTWQLDNIAPPEELYHERYSFKSGVNPTIRENLKEVVRHALHLRGGKETYNWLDIASNDGTLLSYVPKNIKRVGIDPLKQFAEEARTHADLIIEDFFDLKHFTSEHGIGTYDVITSVSMFYDVPDPVQFAKDVSCLMDLDSVWVIQQNYLPEMVWNCSIDNVSHEHLCYHSIESMQYIATQAELEIIDIEFSPVNGGCFRIVLAHQGEYVPNPSVLKELVREGDQFWGIQIYETFKDGVERELDALKRFIYNSKRAGKTVMIYGASTRGGVIWQLAWKDFSHIDAVVDRNPEKVGKYMTSIGVPIISEDEMRKNPPDILLVGPWWFKDQFIEREYEYIADGGMMVFPLPMVEAVFYENKRKVVRRVQ